MGNWSPARDERVRQATTALAARRANINEKFPAIERPCGTPGAVYTVTVEGGDLGCIAHLPFNIDDAIPASAKEEMKAELHDALLPIIERFYRKVWPATIAGKKLADDPKPMPKRWELLFAKWIRRKFEREEWPLIEGRERLNKYMVPTEYRSDDFRDWPE